MEQMNLQITQTAQPTFTVEVVQNLIPVITAQVVIGAGGGGATVVFGDTMTGTGTPSDPVNVSNDILDQIQDNASQIAEIQETIPATANAQNQLADQGFVNSSIQTATAYFRGDWATWADVPSDPALYPADATGNHTPITNDYMVVIADEQENGGTWRYKYTGIWAEQGKSGWMPEYQVNETPLTAAQLAALNSGVTAQKVADITTNKNAIAGLQANKQDKLTAGTGITIEGNTISSTGGGTSLPDQTGNAGKFLQTNGTEASWSDKPLVNNATVADGIAIGRNSTATQGSAVSMGLGAKAEYLRSIAIGGNAISRNAHAIQIGKGTNSDSNTLKIGNENGNFELMDASGNVPLERLTYVTNQIGDISTALTAILGE